MSTPEKPHPKDDLRDQAEQHLTARLHGAGEMPEALARDPEAVRTWQTQQHELQVHQIELEIQNEELRRTVLELEETRDKYLDLYDFAPVGYFTLDRGGAVLEANLTGCKLLGVERAMMLRRRFALYVEEEERGRFASFLRRVFESPGRRSLELRLARQDGATFYAQIECVCGESGGASQARAVVVDISALKTAQEEVMRLNTTLEQRVEERTAHVRLLGEELETFVQAVSHDLLMPLRHITGFAQLLNKELGSKELGSKERALGEQGERYLGHILQSVDRMNRLIEALFSFFRFGRQRARFVPVDLNRVFVEVRKDLAPELLGREVQVTSGDLPTVIGDSNTLQLVLSNLLANALKFTRGREDAHIHVSARDTGREVVVSVRDNGVGFNMRQKDKLFSVFSRLHSEHEFEGTGMGLALVRRIVLRHGGRVWAEGKPGEGATFSFALPKTPPALD